MCRAGSTMIACASSVLYDRRDLAEARRDLAASLAKWQSTCSWAEDTIAETLTF